MSTLNLDLECNLLRQIFAMKSAKTDISFISTQSSPGPGGKGTNSNNGGGGGGGVYVDGNGPSGVGACHGVGFGGGGGGEKLTEQKTGNDGVIVVDFKS